MSTPEEPLVDREDVQRELRRVREDVRQRALHGESPLPAPAPVHVPGPLPHEAPPADSPLPARPQNEELNRLWEAPRHLVPGGLRGFLLRLLGGVDRGALEAQVAFNSRQVRFDNELLGYVEERLAATHRHYDAVLGITGRHMGEIDERHMILQEELVSHVHDLVGRIDLVLGEAERGRVSVELGLAELRERLVRLEQALARR